MPSILKQKLASLGLRVAVIENHTKLNKEEKILSAFEVLLADRALSVNSKLWNTGFIEEMREWTMIGNTHDDALDAVAGCLLSQPVRLPIKHCSTIHKHNWQGGGAMYNGYKNFNI